MRHEKVPRCEEEVLPLEGPVFDEAQRRLSHFNAKRLDAGLGDPASPQEAASDAACLALEALYIASARRAIAGALEGIPTQAAPFVDWFEDLRVCGSGQGDTLFPWLAACANRDQLRWFLHQEVAGEAGFDDLVALTQVKMPERAKLEMARNYWDEMGRGDAKGMHGPMLGRLAAHLGLHPVPETTVAESLALGNMMVALACNRRFAFHAVGALGVIELTAPTRAGYVAEALQRIGVPKKQSHYFSLHAVLDLKHSESWNREVLASLVAEDARRARAIAEGALLRLWCGARCFARYRREFGMS